MINNDVSWYTNICNWICIELFNHSNVGNESYDKIIQFIVLLKYKRSYFLNCTKSNNCSKVEMIHRNYCNPLKSSHSESCLFWLHMNKQLYLMDFEPSDDVLRSKPIINNTIYCNLHFCDQIMLRVTLAIYLVIKDVSLIVHCTLHNKI